MNGTRLVVLYRVVISSRSSIIIRVAFNVITVYERNVKDTVDRNINGLVFVMVVSLTVARKVRRICFPFLINRRWKNTLYMAITILINMTTRRLTL